MLDVGDVAPDFSLSRVEERYATYMLSAATSECPVVLTFVPSNGTDARSFLDALESIDWTTVTDAITIFAIGVDSEPLEGLVEDAENSFPVLLDPDRYVLGLYDVSLRTSGDGPRRTIYLVSQGTSVAFAWEATDQDVEPPLADLRSAVAGLREGDDGDD